MHGKIFDRQSFCTHTKINISSSSYIYQNSFQKCKIYSKLVRSHCFLASECILLHIEMAGMRYLDFVMHECTSQNAVA